MRGSGKHGGMRINGRCSAEGPFDFDFITPVTNYIEYPQNHEDKNINNGSVSKNDIKVTKFSEKRKNITYIDYWKKKKVEMRESIKTAEAQL